ncbi:MAG: urease accessory protein UreD [Clostridia bacterium]
MRLAEPIAASCEPLAVSWKARLDLGFALRGDQTILAEKRFDGPLAVQKPLYPEGPRVCHAIVVHPPAGIAGGDELEVGIDVASGANVLLTTPGAGKWYRSGGPWARQALRFRVDGALEWLPQETIVFDGALADVRCEVELAQGARYLGWEILCLGRTGSGERFAKGRLSLRNSLRRDGRLLWWERGDVEAGGRLMRSAAGLNGRSVCATLVAASPAIDAATVAACREVEEVAITLLPGVLLARHLGDSSEQAKRRFVRLWKILRPAVLGLEAVEPRIWGT